jgi:hypothetical protein
VCSLGDIDILLGGSVSRKREEVELWLVGEPKRRKTAQMGSFKLQRISVRSLSTRGKYTVRTVDGGTDDAGWVSRSVCLVSAPTSKKR